MSTIFFALGYFAGTLVAAVLVFIGYRVNGEKQ
jgi:energy-converting hydrogenase Eha subunit B